MNIQNFDRVFVDDIYHQDTVVYVVNKTKIIWAMNYLDLATLLLLVWLILFLYVSCTSYLEFIELSSKCPNTQQFIN